MAGEPFVRRHKHSPSRRASHKRCCDATSGLDLVSRREVGSPRLEGILGWALR
jgi:hypothetical protein